MLQHSVFIVESNQTIEEKISDNNLVNQSFSPEKNSSESEHELEKESPGKNQELNPDEKNSESKHGKVTPKTESKEVEDDPLVSKKYNLSKNTTLVKIVKCRHCLKNILPLHQRIHELKCSKKKMKKPNDDSISTSNVSEENNPAAFHDKCEFCEKIFDIKSNLGLKKRYHLYSNHFYKEINDEIESKSSGTVCPAENCNHSAKSKGNLINHYIGATHGILDKYIDAKRKKMYQKNKASNVDDTDKICTTPEDILTEVKYNDSQDVTEVSKNLKRA